MNGKNHSASSRGLQTMTSLMTESFATGQVPHSVLDKICRYQSSHQKVKRRRRTKNTMVKWYSHYIYTGCLQVKLEKKKFWNWSWWSMFTELVFNEVRVDRTLVFCVVFCRSLFVFLSISIWPETPDEWPQITPLYIASKLISAFE
jgi:hypothetical protein